MQKFEIYTGARITAAVFLFARTWAAHTEYHVAGAHNKEGAQRVMKRNNSKVYQRRAPSEKNVETCGCECRKFCIMHSLRRAFNKERRDECSYIFTHGSVCRVICASVALIPQVTAGGYLLRN